MMGKIARLGPWVAALLLASCGNYPRDIAGTLDRIQSDRALRVGYVPLAANDIATAKTFVARLEHVTGAKASATFASTERQLSLLEDGKLDLVMGEFAEDTPWLSDVAVIEPLSERREGQRKIGLAAVAANGENRWIMLLEREIRNMREGAGK